MSQGDVHFPTETEGLTEARATEAVELADGDEFELRIDPAVKQLGDSRVRMLAYNGSIPGPTCTFTTCAASLRRKSSAPCAASDISCRVRSMADRRRRFSLKRQLLAALMGARAPSLPSSAVSSAARSAPVASKPPAIVSMPWSTR